MKLKAWFFFITLSFLTVVSTFFSAAISSAAAGAISTTVSVADKTKEQVLQKVLAKYSKARSLQFDIKKIDEKIILGSRSESQGVLKFQKNNIYFLQNGDKKIEAYYSNKTLTLIEHPDEDFNTDPNTAAKRKVTILKDASSPLIKNLLSLFSSPQKFNNEFSTLSEKSFKEIVTVELRPKQKNIKNLSLKINTQELSIVELTFIDDVETKTTLQFSNLKLNSKMKKSDFQYKPLKTDEVMTQ